MPLSTLRLPKLLGSSSRDGLVCGICNESIQRRLLAENDLSLVRALELAQGMEAAERNSKLLKSTKTAVHKVNTRRTPATSSCYRCERSNHEPEDCRFCDAICHHCNKKGHIAPAYRTKQKGTNHKSENRPASK